MNLKPSIFGAAIFLSIVALMGWSYNWLDDQRSGALAAIAEADTCDQLARDGMNLRRHGATVASEPARQVELNRQIAQAAQDAGLPVRNLERIEHDAPRRAAESADLLERPTRFSIRQTTLRQLASMLQSLDRPADGMRITRIHLAAPDDASDTSTWTAEATLTDSAAAPASVRTNLPNPQKSP